MGPVDEIKYFSLIDFRRLASDPNEAASRLRQKFIALKDESYLLYLDALNAWHTSPLFCEYVENLAVALTSHQTLNSVLGADKENIQMSEVQAIINMEKTLA